MSNSSEYEGQGLTPEELAALNDVDADDEAALTQGELEARAAAGESATPTPTAAPAPEPEDDDDDQDQTAGSAAAVPDVAAGATPAADDADPAPTESPQPEPTAAPSAAPQQAPILVAQVPADAEARLNKIAEDKRALIKQYEDGDITLSELETQREKLEDQRIDLKNQISRAEIAHDLEMQRRKNQWDSDCDGFMAAHPEYHGEANAEAFGHLNETVKALANMPRNATLSGQQILEKAHKITQMERGTPVAATPTAAPAKPKQPIPKPALPPNLGAMPAASGNDPGEGRWSNLDRLQTSDPAAYEKALEKLSESDREAYLAA